MKYGGVDGLFERFAELAGFEEDMPRNER